MGWTEKLHGLFINESDEYKNYTYHMKPKTFHLEFHKSWDWLMPVVEKIESLDLKEYGYQWEGIDGKTEYNNGSICVEIERNRCWIYMNLQLDPFHTFNEKSRGIEFPTKIEATYAAVVEFIEWYNERKKQEENERNIT